MDKQLKRKINSLSLNKNEEDMRLDLYSTLIPFLLSKEEFKRNADVRVFTDQLIIKKELKDYLFASRTQIVARIVREIESYDEEQLINNIEILKKYALNEKVQEKRKEIPRDEKQSKAEEKILRMLNKYSRNKDNRGE
ncbi:hypothetical protein [Lactococcus garvieae]|uniref:hypothetical protein n=1 Tax=Lactococcus garvieae TaxID=1363 RepID=UPI00398E6969